MVFALGPNPLPNTMAAVARAYVEKIAALVAKVVVK